MMTLRDIISRLGEFDREHTIYADGGPAAALDDPAVVAFEPDDGSLPAEANGLDYFLEVSLAQEVLVVWKSWRDGREPSIDEAHEAVAYYATNDAYMPA
jgi:hypothetical protein